jgi:anti-sigma B factor antagonist
MTMTLELDPPIGITDSPTSHGPLPFHISVSETDIGVTMVLAGELDMAAAPALREALADVSEGLEGDLILDLAQLTFIDSSGLTLFVQEHKNLQSRGHELIILDPTQRTSRLFQIAGLDQFFTVRRA